MRAFMATRSTARFPHCGQKVSAPTLVATLPLYLRALRGKGAYLATVNDYLAQRDAEWMKPIYQLLGLSVGVIQTQMSQTDRRQAYACDITYGTAKEFGFDFLRDRLLLRANGQSLSMGLEIFAHLYMNHP